MTVESVMWLLPVFFMIHDFEEIIMFKPWIENNSSELRRRFPRFTARSLPIMERLSTSSFALVVLAIFVPISVLTYITVEMRLYSAWTGLMLVFFSHLILHIIQFGAYRKYVPVIITSFICCLYCAFALYYMLGYINWMETLLWVVTVIILGGLDFFMAFKLADRFERYLKAGF